jgi:hypothetical protein
MISAAGQYQPLMDVPGATRLTFNGRLSLTGVAPYREGDGWFPTLGGSWVRVALPVGWQVQSVSSTAEFERREWGVGVRRESGTGFQRGARGSSLIYLLPDVDRVHPDSLVKMRDGLFAYYRLDWDAGTTSSFSLWQGPYSDVYAWGLSSLERALEVFTRLVARDTPAGAMIERPHGWNLTTDEMFVDCGSLVLDMRKREEGMVPLWKGAPGTHVELYRADDSDHHQYLVVVSPSAFVEVSRNTGEGPVTDSEIAEIAAALEVEWT